MPPHRVVIVVQEGFLLLDVAIPVHVFGDYGEGRYEHCVVGTGRGKVRSSSGWALPVDGGLDHLGEADTVIVPGSKDVARRPSDGLINALRSAAGRGARVVSICTGAFTLAFAGLLDGREATTHWSVCDVMTDLFPAIRVNPNVLYVDDGSGVLTSAGVAAGLDLCLHIVRTDHGASVAAAIARHTVIAPHRDGGQAQFIHRPIADHSGMSLSPTLAWALAHLDEQLDVRGLASRAGMSVRSFARHFRDETGTTPLQWLLTQRIARAQQLLETTEQPIETIAHRCGFADAHHLRRHFARTTATTPNAYRTTFSELRAAAGQQHASGTPGRTAPRAAPTRGGPTRSRRTEHESPLRRPA